ncbi:hypothetical protein SEUCBS139899_005436 [Sporothrix eucalyptigena]|uniref:2EXR domain-containing protein n=1 Tax=Sporothrix eucalyptigena TaxID=1812306 RepID=A0ABP0CSS7_9PEZI
MSSSTATHYPPTPVAIASPDATALAFRRADGSRREFFFDDSLRSLPHPAASIFLLNRSPEASLPRNVLRPFRRTNDEPSSHIHFVRETRQSVCRDGQDRSRCSACHEKVTGTAIPAKTAHRRFMMSPQRVFRDLIMSDVAEPLRPALREALFQAFNATMEAPQQQQVARPLRKRSLSQTQQQLQQFAHLSMSRPLLPSPPPSPTRPNQQEDGDTEYSDNEDYDALCPPTAFRYFSRLPYEIRRMIWEQALPFRVLLRDDIKQSTYRGVRHVFRPASHRYSLELLWRSDLFHVCSEARRVVEAFHDSVKNSHQASSSVEGWPSPEEEPMAPLLRQTTTRTRLGAELDVLYYPWLGSESIHGHGGVRSTWTPARYHQEANGVHHISNITTPYPSWMSKPDNITGDSSSSSPSSSSSSSRPTSRRASAAATLPSAPLSAVPYSYWATQLRLLQLPITTVALDVAWIDRGHADTIAWAAGVDLSEPEVDGELENTSTAKEVIPPPTSLQVVVADILVPVRIRLERRTLTPPQRRLLRQHIAPQPWIDTRRHRRDAGRQEAPRVSTTSSSSSSPLSSCAPSPTSLLSPPPTNLNGMDVTVLVDLYDDWRIEELLSLQSSNAGDILNKSAHHRCIACTRKTWETRDRDHWARNFGPLLGACLQKLCRPTIVFSIVLEFDGIDEIEDTAQAGDTEEAAKAKETA